VEVLAAINGTLSISSENDLTELGFGPFVDLQGGTLQPKTPINSARSLVFLTPGGTIETNNGSGAPFSGAVLGPGALTKTGAGMLTLTGTNTCAGGTNINGGTLAVENGENLGSGPLSFHSGTLESLSIGDGLVFANSITLYAGGGTFLADAGTVVVDSYNNLGKGPIRLRGGTLKVLGGN
jgi:fibronectin-binding autotransporter adhesin